MKDEPRKRYIPNPKVEALVRKATNDLRLTDEQREKAAARLSDLEKLKVAINAEQMSD